MLPLALIGRVLCKVEADQSPTEPPQLIAAGGQDHPVVAGCTTSSTSPVKGTAASVTYATDGFALLCGWNNPRVGSNSVNTTRSGPNKSRYLVVREADSGNQSAQMKFWVLVHPDYSVRDSLRGLGADPSQGIRHLRPGEAVVSVRDVVDY